LSGSFDINILIQINEFTDGINLIGPQYEFVVFTGARQDDDQVRFLDVMGKEDRISDALNRFETGHNILSCTSFPQALFPVQKY
jgi:hypothetical protein